MLSQTQSILKIVTIGGGGGHSALLRALKDLPVEITALCNTVDDGGGSGRLMKEYGVHHPGEVRRVMSALLEKPEILEYRFPDGQLKGQTVGNLMIAGLELSTGSFDEALKKIQEWLKIPHKVGPLTENNPILHARTEGGKEIVGQAAVVEFVTQHSDPIHTLWIDPPKSPLSALAKEALLEADYIIVAMGDLYSSIAPSLCIKDVWQEIKAKVIWFPNFVVTPGHIHYKTTSEALKFLQQLNPFFQPGVIITHEGDLPFELNQILKEKGYGKSVVDLETTEKCTVIKEYLVNRNFVPKKQSGDVIDRSPIVYDNTILRSIFEKIFV